MHTTVALIRAFLPSPSHGPPGLARRCTSAAQPCSSARVRIFARVCSSSEHGLRTIFAQGRPRTAARHLCAGPAREGYSVSPVQTDGSTEGRGWVEGWHEPLSDRGIFVSFR